MSRQASMPGCLSVLPVKIQSHVSGAVTCGNVISPQSGSTRKTNHIAHIPPSDGEKYTKIVGSTFSLVIAHFCDYVIAVIAEMYTHTKMIFH